MGDQYCQITSWIASSKGGDDPDYATAIKDLCLDSFLKKSRQNHGLTFLYQGDKAIRKTFCKKVFTPHSREAVIEFKRHILPDIFTSPDDFNTKEVGNILGFKYEVIEATDKHIKFKGAHDKPMVITLVHSFTHLFESLEKLIKIYKITSGEPQDSDIPYRAPFTPHKKGGTEKDADELRTILTNNFLMPFIDIKAGISPAKPLVITNVWATFSCIYDFLQENIIQSEYQELKPILEFLLSVLPLFATCEIGLINYYFVLTDIVQIASKEYSLLLRTFINKLFEESKNILQNGGNNNMDIFYSKLYDNSEESIDGNLLTELTIFADSFKNAYIVNANILEIFNKFLKKYIFQGKFINIEKTHFKKLNFDKLLKFTDNSKEYIENIIIKAYHCFLKNICILAINDSEIDILGAKLLLLTHNYSSNSYNEDKLMFHAIESGALKKAFIPEVLIQKQEFILFPDTKSKNITYDQQNVNDKSTTDFVKKFENLLNN